MMKWCYMLRLLLQCLLIVSASAIIEAKSSYNSGPLYFCTAASADYYPRLVNLIGCIHKVNFDELGEIAVFDLGLTKDQIKHLNGMKKVTISKIERTHPDLLKQFKTMPGKTVPGWYAWKSVTIKQALEKYPYVLWIDAGTTVLRPLNDLFKHIRQHGYFLCTIGSDLLNNIGCLDVRWCTTRFVAEKFNLLVPENQWILDAECVMGGLQGVTRKAADKFVLPMYEFSKDIRYYQDDGTAFGGQYCGRHDQPLLSILAYSKGLTVFKQDYKQNIPIDLMVNEQKVPFYITYEGQFVCNKTHIYNSRGDIPLLAYYMDCIRKK